MDPATAIRLIALRDVLRGKDRNKFTPEYDTRRIIRWYSKTFFTPISEVEEIPFEEVLQAYFEEQYENCDERELEQERLELLRTEEEIREAQLAEDEDSALVFEERLNVQEEEAKEAQKPVQVPGLIKAMHNVVKEAELITKELKEIPEAVKIEFVDNLDDLGEMDSLGLFDKPKA